MDKKWKKIDIFTSSEGVEPLSFALFEVGQHSFSVVDSADLDNLMEGKYGAWDYIDPDLIKHRDVETTITLYLTDDELGQAGFKEISDMLAKLKLSDTTGKLGRLECDVSVVQDENWADAWKKDYEPVVIGDKLMICPTWMDFDPGDKALLVIDPGLAFGTGLDETTRLCLEVLEGLNLNGFSILDIGCGSGILSIAALLMGASFALGVDIDETAVITAKENAALNDVSDRSEFIFGNLVKAMPEPYDIICANISAGVILTLAGEFPRYLKPGGQLVLSGIMENHVKEITFTLKESGLYVVEQKEDSGWVCLLCR